MARNPRASSAERAVAYCWIFHIVGDIHQPLHAAEYFSSGTPDGDFAGDKFYLVDPATGETVKPHHFWEFLAQAYDESNAVLATGSALIARPPRSELLENS